MSNTPTFSDLNTLLDNNKKDDNFKYLQAFDSYIKHIKTIFVTVRNSFMLGNSNEFLIREFVYDGVSYPTMKALDKVKKTNDYVIQTVEDILLEVQKQLANCLDNSKRIQTISFKQLIKENPKSNAVEYISFFIDVQNGISELPQEIKVLPLIIKPNDEIYSFDFRFHKIFIKKKGCGEECIIGCAQFYLVETKKTALNLQNLGQLLIYCKLCNPEEAYLLSSGGLGSLKKVLNNLNREDLLDYGSGKRIKKIKVARWDITKDGIDNHSIVPKI